MGLLDRRRHPIFRRQLYVPRAAQRRGQGSILDAHRLLVHHRRVQGFGWLQEAVRAADALPQMGDGRLGQGTACTAADRSGDGSPSIRTAGGSEAGGGNRG
jgi:hypothetical protein